MTEDEREKAEEILKKRRMAAKGLKERPDGKAVDPMEDFDSLDPDDKDMTPPEPGEREKEVAKAAVAGMAIKRSG